MKKLIKDLYRLYAMALLIIVSLPFGLAMLIGGTIMLPMGAALAAIGILTEAEVKRKITNAEDKLCEPLNALHAFLKI